jgi:ParB/RepB/Spo0J family partition protein
MTATLVQVPVDRIAAHDSNVRRDVSDLTELAASIKGMGVLQPLVVAPDPGTEDQGSLGYVLVAGHRRHAAAVKAGLAKVPCIVRADLDTPAKVIQAMLVENLQRTDLTVMEEADAYAQLELLGVKEAAIVKATGRAKSTVHQRRQLASLPEERRQQVADGKLTIEAGVACAKLRTEWADDEEILALIDEAEPWQFSSSYGLTYKIQRVLDARNPQPEEGDDDAIDYSGQRAEREAQWEKDRAEREARLAALAASTERMYDWLSGRIAVQAQTVIDGLIDWSLKELRDNYSTDTMLPVLGIDPPGEDEDVDDADLRIAASLKALPHQEKVIALALAVSGAANRKPYWFDEHARSLATLGYPLTDEDRALMKAEEQ